MKYSDKLQYNNYLQKEVANLPSWNIGLQHDNQMFIKGFIDYRKLLMKLHDVIAILLLHVTI